MLDKKVQELTGYNQALIAENLELKAKAARLEEQPLCDESRVRGLEQRLQDKERELQGYRDRLNSANSLLDISSVSGTGKENKLRARIEALLA